MLYNIFLKSEIANKNKIEEKGLKICRKDIDLFEKYTNFANASRKMPSHHRASEKLKIDP